MIDEKFNGQFRDNVIPVIKGLKTHATNILLCPNNLVVLQTVIPRSRSYAIFSPDIDYTPFMHTYLDVVKANPIAAKFKKKKSEVVVIYDNDQPYLRIKNDNDDTYEGYIMKYDLEREDLINSIYHRVPHWEERKEELLIDEPDGAFSPVYDGLPEDIKNKKLCTITVDVQDSSCDGKYWILLSKPFFGDTKATEEIRFRIDRVDAENHKMTLKFKQKEPWGNIYHWASFMMIPSKGYDYQ